MSSSVNHLHVLLPCKFTALRADIKAEMLTKAGPTQPVFISERRLIRGKTNCLALRQPLQLHPQLKLNCAIFTFKGKSMHWLSPKKAATYEHVTDLTATKHGFEIKHIKMTVCVLWPNAITRLPSGEANKVLVLSREWGSTALNEVSAGDPSSASPSVVSNFLEGFFFFLNSEDVNGFLAPFPGAAHSSQLN